MSNKLRNRLLHKRNLIVRDTAERLLAEETEDVSDSLVQIADLDTLLADLPHAPKGQRFTAIVIGLICLTVISLGWTLRVPESRLTLHLESQSIAFKLDEPKDLTMHPRIYSQDTRLAEFSEITLPTPELTLRILKQSPFVELNDGKVWLTKLEIAKGTRLSIHRLEDDFVDIYAQGAAVRGELGLLDQPEVSGGSGETGEFSYLLDIAIPESVSFYNQGGSAVPAWLRIHAQQAFTVYDLRVNGLSFSYDVPEEPGTPVFISSISGGTLMMTDIAKNVKLTKGERLALDGVHGRITEMHVGEQLDIQFEGVAEIIRLGPKGFERNLTPTLLEYVYYNQRLSFFWAAVTFLWGMIWSIRKLMFLNG